MSKEENPFGEVIYAYTEEQAIEDGFKADLGFYCLEFGRVRITTTTGFITELKPLQVMHILLKTLGNIKPKTPNWVVFRDTEEKEHLEDQKRTLIVPMKGLEKKVYAILDDNGNHYVLTFLLASEY